MGGPAFTRKYADLFPLLNQEVDKDPKAFINQYF
jgi:hypothetical protein